MSFLLILITNTFAQSSQNKCECSALLGETIEKVSTIYAGFKDKVTSQTRPEYNRLVKHVRREAITASHEKRCYEILKEYTDWFKDGHVGVWFSVPSTRSDIRTVPLTEIPSGLAETGVGLVGMWSTADQSEQYAIIPDKRFGNQYLAINIKSVDSAWIPGMVKVEFYNFSNRENLYRGLYYKKDFSGVLNGFTLNNDRIDHWFGQSWYRNGTTNANANPEISDPVVFRQINKQFTYLKLGRFDQQVVDRLDSLIKVNRSIIQNSKNMIIDLRGNPGGNAGSSQEMIRLIYTNPIIYPAWQYRSSPELIKSRKKLINELSLDDPYNSLKTQQILLQRLIEHPGELVSGGDSIIRTVDSTDRYPEKVAFLVDKKSGSSAEFFTFEGKQSKKVTLFGTPTAGVMDYGEDQSISLSCGKFIITIPWGRNGWIDRFGFRVDNIGFMPDILIPPTEKDWINFVVKYWSK
jgi:hypothetical protein